MITIYDQDGNIVILKEDTVIIKKQYVNNCINICLHSKQFENGVYVIAQKEKLEESMEVIHSLNAQIRTFKDGYIHLDVNYKPNKEGYLICNSEGKIEEVLYDSKLDNDFEVNQTGREWWYYNSIDEKISNVVHFEYIRKDDVVVYRDIGKEFSSPMVVIRVVNSSKIEVEFVDVKGSEDN